MTEQNSPTRAQLREERIKADLLRELGTLTKEEQEPLIEAFGKKGVRIAYGEDMTLEVTVTRKTKDGEKTEPANARQLSEIRSYINKQFRQMKPEEQLAHTYDALVEVNGQKPTKFSLRKGAVVARFDESAGKFNFFAVQGTGDERTEKPITDEKQLTALRHELQGVLDEELGVGREFIGKKNVMQNKGPIGMLLGAAMFIPKLVREVTGSTLAGVGALAVTAFGALNFVGKLLSGEVVRPELFKPHDEGEQVGVGEKAKDLLNGMLNIARDSFSNLDGLQHLAGMVRREKAAAATR